MMFYDNDRNYQDEFRGFWNQNVKKYRRWALILGIVMIILSILCFTNPIRSMYVLEVIASIVMICIGIGGIATYSSTPVYFRFGGSLISSILNILLGIMLILSPAQEMMMTFAFIFGIEMMSFGIQELSVSHRLKFFGIADTGVHTFSGVMNIICAFILFFMPQVSIAISWIIAAYLLIGGISLLINGINAKTYEM
jgi:uncharacterized membrane protein HdeD (DUF308 family)